ncbi:hypothetical protein OH460_21225 [Vibrio sp. Makdt]|uniref:hypothetical protein n=1 Tax=Vibrio sp. Makdt TaxID=2998828 RepID=UPI0022CDA9A0|nr:hypothetical protein [Vibrio sp. Makdt]MDA0154846.1 hypothetical protein [Vibrio sp. Makdt]
MAIETRSLNFYPKLYCAINNAYRWHILHHMQKNCPNKNVPETIIKTYACFLHVITGHDKTFDNLKVQNDTDLILEHIMCYVGFCITELKTDENSSLGYARRIYAALTGISVVKTTDFPLSKDKFNAYISIYHKYRIEELVEYYEGWKATTLDQKKVRLHLAFLYDSTNKEFVDFVHSACINYFAKHKKVFADTSVRQIVKLLQQIVTIYIDSDSIILSISPENISKTFEMILHLDLLRVKKSKSSNALRNLIRNEFPSKVRLYRNLFIDTHLIEEPVRKIIIPTLKGLKNSERYHSSGGGLTKETMVKLTSGIPLDIPNKEAFEIIKNRLRDDIKHITNHSINMVRQVINKHNRIQQALHSGVVKPLPKHGANLGSGISAVTYPYGKNHLDNTIATFYNYGFKGVESYSRFLVSKGDEMTMAELVEELNIPTLKTIYPFLLLLVREHPELVPSSFENWDLYDSNGRLTGFKESNGVSLISTFKHRKGSKKAAQLIPTTRLSKICIEALIEHTRYSREYLKSIGDPNWKKLLLVCRSINKKPRPINFVRREHDSYYDLFDCFDYKISKNSGMWVTKNEKVDIFVSLRSLRSSIAVFKYLNTSSLRVFHKTLGHSSSYSELIDAYLPDVLQRYVQERDIRVFQNTVIYLAMKDNPLLPEVLDGSIIDVDRFFSEHGFNVDSDEDIEKIEFNNLEIIITVQLLQLMLYILKLDELDAEELNLSLLTFEKWRLLSLYVITHIKSSIDNTTKIKVSDDIIGMYNDALSKEISSIILRSRNA